MADATSITVNVNVSIPDDTINRCLRVLEMWMDDNPDKNIIVERVYGETKYHHKLHIESKVKTESE